MQYVLGLLMVAGGILLRPLVVSKCWQQPSQLLTMFQLPKPDPLPVRWWTELVQKWWKRAWAFSAALVLAVIGVMMSSDAQAADDISWVRGVWSMLALLVGLVGVGSIIEMNVVLFRLARQHQHRFVEADVGLWIGLTALSSGLAGLGVARIAAAIV